MNLKEKIDYEFERFFLDQMRTTKENIFAHSQEIELKKKVAHALYTFASEADQETQRLLLGQGNLLESAYRYVADQEPKKPQNGIPDSIREWLIHLPVQGVHPL